MLLLLLCRAFPSVAVHTSLVLAGRNVLNILIEGQKLQSNYCANDHMISAATELRHKVKLEMKEDRKPCRKKAVFLNVLFYSILIHSLQKDQVLEF